MTMRFDKKKEIQANTDEMCFPSQLRQGLDTLPLNGAEDVKDEDPLPLY